MVFGYCDVVESDCLVRYGVIEMGGKVIQIYGVDVFVIFVIVIDEYVVG